MKQLRLALQGLHQEEEEGTERPNRSAPGQGGVDSRPAALMRETDRNRSTEQSEFQETPIVLDERGHLHETDGSKTLKTILTVWGSSEGSCLERGNPEEDGLSKRSARLTPY